MSSLAGKVAIITGASSGIGAATAVHFSRLGAVLAITGRNAENLAKTARECRESGGQEPLIIGADLVKEEDCVKIISETVDKFGKLDVLVNNAGVLEMGSIENTSLEQYDRVMGTNMRAVYHLTMMAVPHLEVTKGNIVNVSSVNGIRSFPGISNERRFIRYSVVFVPTYHSSYLQACWPTMSPRPPWTSSPGVSPWSWPSSRSESTPSTPG